MTEIIEVITNPIGQELLHRRPATLASKVYFLIKAILAKLALDITSLTTSGSTTTKGEHSWLEDLVRLND